MSNEGLHHGSLVLLHKVPQHHIYRHSILQTLPRNKLYSGNSEIRNWVGIAGAVEHLGLNRFEYVPSYRIAAGAGTGLSFASRG